MTANWIGLTAGLVTLFSAIPLCVIRAIKEDKGGIAYITIIVSVLGIVLNFNAIVQDLTR